jgi:Bacterial membrane flanked domain.
MNRTTIPLLWALLTGVPILVIGFVVPSVGGVPASTVGLPFFILGMCVCIGSVLAALLSPPSPPTKVVDEAKAIKEYHPTQRVPVIFGFVGLIAVAAGYWILFETTGPVGYGLISGAAGVWMYGAGTVRLWRHTLTVYCITPSKLIKSYRLFGKIRQTMPRAAVQATEKRVGIVQRLLRVGLVKVETAGDTGTSVIVATNLQNPEQFLRRVEG